MWMNVCCHVGRATSDPVERVTKGGTPYVTIRVAVLRSPQHTDFLTFECFGKVAQFARRNVRKGEVLSLRSESRQATWETQGQRRERPVFAVKSLGVVRMDLSKLGPIPDDDEEAIEDGTYAA